MALHYELPVYKACYDLLLEVCRFTKGFSTACCTWEASQERHSTPFTRRWAYLFHIRWTL
jgi:hypothetical protein